MKKYLKYVLIGCIVGLTFYFARPLIVILSYIYIGIEQEISYKNSFKKTYKEYDYNDSVITFYKKELEKNYIDFLNSNTEVDRFKNDTKIKIADSCIKYRLKKHSKKWLDEALNFKYNARNKAVHNDDKLFKKLKQINHKLQLGFYRYNFNVIDDTIEDIVGVWSKNHNVCDDKVDTQKIYDTFLDKYLKKYISLYTNPDKDDKEWLIKIKQTSKTPFYKKLSIDEIRKQNNFKDAQNSVDVSFKDSEFFVADSHRGIELWQQKGDEFIFKKTLDGSYKAFLIKKSDDFLFVVGEKDFYRYFLVYSYDKKVKKVKIINKHKIKAQDTLKWVFFDNCKKVAIVCRYGGLIVLDIHNIHNIKQMPTFKKRSSLKAVIDIAKYHKNIYFLAGDLYLLNSNNPKKSKLILPLNHASSFYIDVKNGMLYIVENLFSKGMYISKYKIIDNDRLKFVDRKKIEDKI